MYTCAYMLAYIVDIVYIISHFTTNNLMILPLWLTFLRKFKYMYMHLIHDYSQIEKVQLQRNLVF